ncbi:hypothetical protein CEXT_93851 [Caerostris extrusa]|uniref:Uncharacterized protein n=1 Tax=Caerostris extrusa TaxID=172846 RepID=A0AAV4P3F1_CAEEX|nr:hypothetical protein CEXT_93851 [Caerostris extrusa]
MGSFFVLLSSRQSAAAWCLRQCKSAPKIEKKVFALPQCTMARNHPLMMKILVGNGDVDNRMKYLFDGNCRLRGRVNVEALLIDEDGIKRCA